MSKDAYKRVIMHGKTVNKRTAAALLEAEHRLGYDLTIIQGSYNTSVSASAGTHQGGGAVDLAPYEYAKKVEALRRIGFAAWHRQAIAGLWVEHIHAGLVGDAEAAPALKQQFADYAAGLNGLADRGRDTDWRPAKLSRFNYWLWRRLHKDGRVKLDALPRA